VSRRRADLQSTSCPPDRQYNISRLLAHFVLSGSFTHCAVLVPRPYKRPSPPPSLPHFSSPPMNHPNPLDSAKRKTARKSIITPQRKHHKMLKDGTSEVWPEDVEKIFIQGTSLFPLLLPSPTHHIPPTGLREYWESPWATFSRGRSRWRNQFLVDYLQKAGVERSRKQVASHIQVLRNMWKGEPGNALHSERKKRYNYNSPPPRISSRSRGRRTIPRERSALDRPPSPSP
jgi:hypothetical protein